MRFSHLSLFALASSSIASPITRRADAISLLEDLYATVQTYTGAINATLAPLSSSSSIIDKTAATIQVGQQLNLITEAITSTTNEFNALPAANATKRSVALEIADTDISTLNSHPKEKRQLIAVGALLGLIIVEIFATITAAVAILGLAGLLVYINPLTAALSLLILTVQLVLNIVLVGVSALLNSLLAALALSIGGL